MVVEDASQVGEARRVAVAIAAERRIRRDATGATSASSPPRRRPTSCKHAGRGEMLLAARAPEGPGLELIAWTRDPACATSRPAWPTATPAAGCMGGGFGAMRRLAREFSIWSAPGTGTALVCRVLRPRRNRRHGDGPPVAGLAVPHAGRDRVRRRAGPLSWRREGATLLVVDGLGHGPAAEEAAATAVQLFRERPRAAPRADAGPAARRHAEHPRRRGRRGRYGPRARRESASPASATSPASW